MPVQLAVPSSRLVLAFMGALALAGCARTALEAVNAPAGSPALVAGTGAGTGARGDAVRGAGPQTTLGTVAGPCPRAQRLELPGLADSAVSCPGVDPGPRRVARTDPGPFFEAGRQRDAVDARQAAIRARQIELRANPGLARPNEAGDLRREARRLDTARSTLDRRQVSTVPRTGPSASRYLRLR